MSDATDDVAVDPLPRALIPWTGFVLGKVAEMSELFFARSLVPLGITPQHLAILMVLDDQGPQKQRRLSTPLQINPATMVRLINECEDASLVVRRPHPDDRRAHLVHITARGTEVMERAVELGAEATAAVFGVLDPDEREQLHGMLVRLAMHSDKLVSSQEDDADMEREHDDVD